MRIDKRIYSDSCISKTIYSLSKKMVIKRTFISINEEELELIDSDSDLSKKEYESILIDKLNDYKLRCIIETETRDIRTILYAKAFEDDDNLELLEDEFI